MVQPSGEVINKERRFARCCLDLRSTTKQCGKDTRKVEHTHLVNSKFHTSEGEEQGKRARE